MKVLVTGNKGYIGAVLVERLLEDDFEVVGLDTDFFKGCNFYESYCDIRQISKDIRNAEAKDFVGIDAVIHLAALSNDPMGALSPELTSAINYSASLNLAKLAKAAGVRRFIFSSSCSVYGVKGDEMIDENGALSPATEYARSKINTEREISKIADTNFSPVFLRNATVYGVSPRLRVDLVVNNLAAWVFTTGSLKIMSDGSPWRPLIHIQDVCRAFIAVLRAPQEIIHNQVFNVGDNAQNYRVQEIASAIKKVLTDCRVEYTGEHGLDTRTYRVNFDKIQRLLGSYFRPRWDLDKGIDELLRQYKMADFTENDFKSDKFTRLARIKNLLKEGHIDANLFWKEPAYDRRTKDNSFKTDSR